ncbi:MAG: class I SAM-dependent methyltransferase [Pirellulales bacterium]|nr:class I SAM-dependent methyltransferase [Pirellulales bacterium]
MATSDDYRWNQLGAAAAYDAAAPVIHPRYIAVQDAVLAAIPFAADQPFRVVDLGSGSGRLVERLLSKFAAASAILMDQSQPFLDLAAARLAPFDGRAACLQRRLQDDWVDDVAPVDLIVSTSAIHHLEPAEKQTLFRKCFAALAQGGVFINGDEHRPASDVEYRALLVQWSEHMHAAVADGRIPESFGATLERWRLRNLEEFGTPRASGDDCLETAEVQVEYLRQAGFATVEVPWSEELWADFVATKA